MIAGTPSWREDSAGSLPPAGVPPVLIQAGEQGRLVRAAPEGVTVTSQDSATAAATVRGTPTAVLPWAVAARRGRRHPGG